MATNTKPISIENMTTFRQDTVEYVDQQDNKTLELMFDQDWIMNCGNWSDDTEDSDNDTGYIAELNCGSFDDPDYGGFEITQSGTGNVVTDVTRGSADKIVVTKGTVDVSGYISEEGDSTLTGTLTINKPSTAGEDGGLTIGTGATLEVNGVAEFNNTVDIHNILDMNGYKITGVASPEDNTDVVTKAYLDNHNALGDSGITSNSDGDLMAPGTLYSNYVKITKSTTVATDSVLMGDLNNNGSMDIGDVAAVYQIAMGSINAYPSLTLMNKLATDINMNGIIDIYDYNKIKSVRDNNIDLVTGDTDFPYRYVTYSNVNDVKMGDEIQITTPSSVLYARVVNSDSTTGVVAYYSNSKITSGTTVSINILRHITATTEDLANTVKSDYGTVDYLYINQRAMLLSDQSAYGDVTIATRGYVDKTSLPQSGGTILASSSDPLGIKNSSSVSDTLKTKVYTDATSGELYVMVPSPDSDDDVASIIHLSDVNSSPVSIYGVYTPTDIMTGAVAASKGYVDSKTTLGTASIDSGKLQVPGNIFIGDTETAVYTPEMNSVLMGDADISGSLNVGDVTKLARYVAGTETPSAIQKLASDLDMDGELTDADVRLRQNMIGGLYTPKYTYVTYISDVTSVTSKDTPVSIYGNRGMYAKAVSSGIVAVYSDTQLLTTTNIVLTTGEAVATLEDVEDWVTHGLQSSRAYTDIEITNLNLSGTYLAKSGGALTGAVTSNSNITTTGNITTKLLDVVNNGGDFYIGIDIDKKVQLGCETGVSLLQITAPSIELTGILGGDIYVTGIKTPSADNEAANKKYVDDTVADAIADVSSSIKFSNVEITASEWSTNSDFSGYGYRATHALTGVTASLTPIITFSLDQMNAGNFASFARTYAGGIYIYSKTLPTGTTTIPGITCV